MPSAQGQAYYLNFSKQTISVPNRTFYVEQVVDGRPGKPVTGTVYRGLQNQPAVVFFRQGLEPELTSLLRQQLPSRPADHPVVLCIRQFRVGEVLNGFTEQASADVAADVYIRLTDGYHFVSSVADHTSTRALESTAIHVPHLALLLNRCLMQLANVNWEKAAERPARTYAQLATDRPPAALRPAILSVAQPRAGVYYFFESFLANRPDTTVRLRLDTLRLQSVGWEGTALLRASAHDADGERVSTRDIWGFSDGRHLYLRQKYPSRGQNMYYQLVPQRDFYTFIGPAPLNVMAANQRALGYNVKPGGMTGKPAPNRQEDDTGQPVAYALDMRTGQTALFPPPGQPQRADSAFIYVYRPLGGLEEPQRILLADKEIGQLKPGQYVELACPHYGSPVRLSLGKVGGPTLLAVPNVATANYVKLVANSALSPWQLMPARQGEAEVDALERPRKP
ncbi:hypothetical protein [Hymenobacter sp. IS2118]|uniref:hypothetical protein n=1 Tax=Hymenobacter sp. IS2118 TaxID=1505605 RepID=UPI00054EB5F4|nr:hypothetical protein [Hymenobacter sp. IS2118]